MSIITVSHQAFGQGRAVAERVAAILCSRCISREALMTARQRYGIAEAKLCTILEEKPHRWWTPLFEGTRFYRIALQAALCELAQEGDIVYHGRAGQEFFPGIRHVLNVFVDTPADARVQQVMTRRELGEGAAKKYLDELDRIRTQRMKEVFKIDWRDPTRYDMVINTAKTSVETAARIIAEVSRQEEYLPTAESLQAMRDLTITARVEAMLMAARLHISSLEVQTRCGEVHVGGMVLSDEIRHIAVEQIRKIPGVSRIKNDFVNTTPEHSLYGDRD
jgi:hypothetical protein